MELNYEKTYFTFTGLKNAKLEDADVVVFPVPYDSTQSYNSGAREGPNAIIRASMDMETYNMKLGREITDFIKIHTTPAIFPDYSSPEAMISQVKNVISQIIKMDKFPVMLGGEHSITLGAVEAFKDKFDDLTILQIDAHTDLRNSYGTKYSHACVMRRAHELGCKIVPVGVRSMSEEEAKYAKEKNIKIFDGTIDESNINEIIDSCGNTVYLTLDVDGLDPSIIPGTGTPEPNGLSWGITLRLLEELFKNKNVIGMDLVEVHPMHGNTMSEDNAARLVYNSLIYKFKEKVGSP